MLRTLAIARIYLDNIDHIKAYWILMGMKLAQVSLSYGVDDIDGTIIEEKIYHMAGAKTPQEAGREELVHAIREAGREPVQRDSLYQIVKREEGRGKGETSGPEELSLSSPFSLHSSPLAGASNEGGTA
jgi:aminodeoxyfutalosine synthase